MLDISTHIMAKMERAKTIPKPCSYPGCSQLVTNSPRCSNHPYPIRKWNKKVDSDNKPTHGAKVWYSRKWQKVRKIKLSINPICEDPHGHHNAMGQTIPAREVHHIQRIEDNPDAAYDLDNLMSLCDSCHDIFTAQERRERIRRLEFEL